MALFHSLGFFRRKATLEVLSVDLSVINAAKMKSNS